VADRIEIRDGKEYRVTVLPDASQKPQKFCDKCGGTTHVHSGRYKNGHRWFMCGGCLKRRSQRRKRAKRRQG
jgi:formylmethanofuran dehydrogenase subunit E